MNASLYKSTMLLAAAAAALAGCATLAPEREAADKLMGQNIYLFQRVGASYARLAHAAP